MAVTNRYDTFKKYSKEQINTFKDIVKKVPTFGKLPFNYDSRVPTYYVGGTPHRFFNSMKPATKEAYEAAKSAYAQYASVTGGLSRNSLDTVIADWTKQSADYYKAFGSTMLAGSNVGVDSANVSVNEVPVDRTDPILEATSTPKRKKRGDGSASALGL